MPRLFKRVLDHSDGGTSRQCLLQNKTDGSRKIERLMLKSCGRRLPAGPSGQATRWRRRRRRADQTAGAFFERPGWRATHQWASARALEDVPLCADVSLADAHEPTRAGVAHGGAPRKVARPDLPHSDKASGPILAVDGSRALAVVEVKKASVIVTAMISTTQSWLHTLSTLSQPRESHLRAHSGRTGGRAQRVVNAVSEAAPKCRR